MYVCMCAPFGIAIRPCRVAPQESHDKWRCSNVVEYKTDLVWDSVRAEKILPIVELVQHFLPQNLRKCMYVCMYVCMYICLVSVTMSVCTYICMYVCMYIYMYVCMLSKCNHVYI